jgi:VWFA-related protein
MMRRLLPIVWCLVGVLPLVQQQPVFRGRTDVVTVDVHVVDGSGRQVADLQAEDFTLKVDGKPRPIVSAEYVWHDVSSVPAPARPATAPARPRSPSNVSPAPTGQGRTIMLVVDEANIRVGNGRQAMTAAERFLGQMGPADRVGLALIPYGQVNIEPTTDRAVVRKALQRIVGHFRPIEPEPPFALGLGEAFAFVNRDNDRWAEVLRRECEKGSLCRQYLEPDALRMVSDARQRLTQSVRSFLALLTALARLPGPKTLILVSEQLPVSKYVTDRQEFNAEASQIAARSALAQASVYVLQLHSPLLDVETAISATPAPPKPGPPSRSQRIRDIVDPVAEDADIRQAGLEHIAGLTGGTLLMISGRLESVFDRIALEISGYYLLGIRAEPADRDGRPHDVGVAVRRPDLHVRARKVFVIYGEEAPDETGATDAVNELLRIPTGATELPLAVATYALPDPGEGKNVRVIISAEIDSGVEIDTVMTVGFVLLDEVGKNAGVSLETIKLKPLRAKPGSPLCYLGAAIVAPGRYTLRLAAADAKLRRGVVEHQFEARLVEAGGLRLSDLIIHDPRQTEPGGARPSVTAALRDTLTASLEVGTQTPGLPPGIKARLEVAATLDGPAIAEAEMIFQASGEERRFQAGGSVPLSGIPPGDYVARAVVALAGGPPIARVTRPFQILPPPQP